MDINNLADWWTCVDKNWGDLSKVISDKMIMGSPAYSVPGNNKSEKTGRTIYEEIEYMKANRNARGLSRYFHAAWALSSDAYAWSVPAWGQLCDLCSEDWVLE